MFAFVWHAYSVKSVDWARRAEFTGATGFQIARAAVTHRWLAHDFLRVRKTRITQSSRQIQKIRYFF